MHAFLYLLTLSALTHACMEFSGSFPFSTTLPFEASITDNGITTCWLSTTYADHAKSQSAHKGLAKRSVGRKISLTTLPPSTSFKISPFSPGHSSAKQEPINEKHVDLQTRPPLRNPATAQGRGMKGKMESKPQDERPAWQNWEFDCLKGYKAHANVGVRGFVYSAHGQEFFFVPKMEEDVWGERWIYKLRLWCDKGKKGKDVGVGGRVGGGKEGKGGKNVQKVQGAKAAPSGQKAQSGKSGQNGASKDAVSKAEKGEGKSQGGNAGQSGQKTQSGPDSQHGPKDQHSGQNGGVKQTVSKVESSGGKIQGQTGGGNGPSKPETSGGKPAGSKPGEQVVVTGQRKPSSGGSSGGARRRRAS